MSDEKCFIKKINTIYEHGNAHSLECCLIDGYNVIIQKDRYKEGDLIVYIETDSVLPEEIESKIFPPDSKIKLKKSRVRIEKIRGVYSEGLIVPIEVLFDKSMKFKENQDITDLLGIKKYEPPIVEIPASMRMNKMKEKDELKSFRQVRKPQHYKKYPDLFIGKLCSLTEKCHGSSYRVGWTLRNNKTFFDKIKIKLFGKYQFAYRSMNVQKTLNQSIFKSIFQKLRLTSGDFYERLIGKDIYTEMVKKYKLKDIIPDGYMLSGEIYGSGVQGGNFNYGCKEGERKLIIFGISKDEVYLKPKEAKEFTEKLGLEFVPIFFEGILTKEVVDEFTKGKSVIDPTKKTIREGIVIECLEENVPFVLLKSISEEFLMKNLDGSDFH